MAAKLKETFTVGDEVYAVKLPTPEQKDAAARVYNKAYREAVDGDAYLRVQVEQLIRDKGIWNDDLQKEHDELETKLLAAERKLAGGNMKLSEGRSLAIQISKDRQALVNLRMIRACLDDKTAEAQAENERFNYFVAVATVYDKSGDSVYSGLEDYRNRAHEEVAQTAANKLFYLIYPFSEDHEKYRPENQFLLKFKFVNDNLRLVNKDGHFIDEEGRLINELGLYVNEKGERVDVNGYRVDELGNYIVDAQPFLDEDGKPIVEVGETTEVTEKKKGRKEKATVS